MSTKEIGEALVNINDKYIPLWDKIKNIEVFDYTIRGKSWGDLTESNKQSLCFIFNYSYNFGNTERLI